MRHRRIPNWVKEKTGSLGLSTGGPIPDTPSVTSSCVLSLSGFFPSLLFRGNGKSGSAAAAANGDGNGNNNDKESRKEEDLMESHRKLVEDSVSLTRKSKDVKNVDMEDEDDYADKQISSSSSSSGTIQKETLLEVENNDEKKKLLSSSFGWATNSR